MLGSHLKNPSAVGHTSAVVLLPLLCSGLSITQTQVQGFLMGLPPLPLYLPPFYSKRLHQLTALTCPSLASCCQVTNSGHSLQDCHMAPGFHTSLLLPLPHPPHSHPNTQLVLNSLSYTFVYEILDPPDPGGSAALVKPPPSGAPTAPG